MGQQQVAAAAALQVQCIQGIPLGVFGLLQPQGGLSLVAKNLATGVMRLDQGS